MKKQTKMQIFIAYFYRNEYSEQDAEIYIGKTGSEKEFIKYWDIAYREGMKEDNIVDICPIDKEMGIDGEYYKIILK